MTSLIHSSPACSKANRRRSRSVGASGSLRIRPWRPTQPVHRGRWQGERIRDFSARAGLADDERHGELGMVFFDRDQEVGDRLRDGARAAAVGAGLRHQGVEAALAVALEPVAQGLRRHSGASAARDGVVDGGLLFDAPIEPFAPGGQVHELGDEPVTGEARWHGGGRSRGRSWASSSGSGQ
jgi:hypothetical protein